MWRQMLRLSIRSATMWNMAETRLLNVSGERHMAFVGADRSHLDDRDAEAIAEAATRPTMRFVEGKSQEQLGMQMLHRIRDQLVGERTALMNQIRSLLLKRGHIVPQGRAKLAVRLGEMLEAIESVLGFRITGSLPTCAPAG